MISHYTWLLIIHFLTIKKTLVSIPPPLQAPFHSILPQKKTSVLIPPPPLKEEVTMDLTSPSQEVQHSGEVALLEAMDSAFRFSPKTKQGRS